MQRKAGILKLNNFGFKFWQVHLFQKQPPGEVLLTVQFNLEAALQTNGSIESDVKEVIKKQLGNATKRKDDEKTQMTQIIGLIQPMLT